MNCQRARRMVGARGVRRAARPPARWRSCAGPRRPAPTSRAARVLRCAPSDEAARARPPGHALARRRAAARRDAARAEIARTSAHRPSPPRWLRAIVLRVGVRAGERLAGASPGARRPAPDRGVTDAPAALDPPCAATAEPRVRARRPARSCRLRAARDARLTLEPVPRPPRRRSHAAGRRALRAGRSGMLGVEERQRSPAAPRMRARPPRAPGRIARLRRRRSPSRSEQRARAGVARAGDSRRERIAVSTALRARRRASSTPACARRSRAMASRGRARAPDQARSDARPSPTLGDPTAAGPARRARRGRPFEPAGARSGAGRPRPAAVGRAARALRRQRGGSVRRRG